MGNTVSQGGEGKPSVVSVVGARPDEPAAAADNASAAMEVPKKKICCACPETKKARDECIVEHGEDACAKWINAHKLCLRQEGFNV